MKRTGWIVFAMIVSGCGREPRTAGRVLDVVAACAEAPDGVACGSECTRGGVCMSGQCVGSVNAPEGTSCQTGDYCTVEDRCSADGACLGGMPLDCNDGDDTTMDSCDSTRGCLHVHPQIDAGGGEIDGGEVGAADGGGGTGGEAGAGGQAGSSGSANVPVPGGAGHPSAPPASSPSSGGDDLGFYEGGASSCAVATHANGSFTAIAILLALVVALRRARWIALAIFALIGCETPGVEFAPVPHVGSVTAPQAASPIGGTLGTIAPSPTPSPDSVLVPAGGFLMGCAPSDGACHPDEYPAHQVTLAGFELDRVEVTQAAYAKCVQTHKCTALASGPVAASPSLPVTGVSFAQAQAYCAFRGKRLPTEAEWEKAARGTDERVYPWGTHVPDCAIANWSLCGGQSRAAAGLAGASPYGAADLAGNVWEWVADFYAPDYYDQSPAADPQGPASGGTRVIRGGSFQTGPDLLRASARAWVDPSATYDSVGFRCARSI